MNEMSMRASAPCPVTDPAVRDFDVLIVGAGISGIGVARHLRRNRPEKTFAILDTKAAHGGTWRMHTYPGVRSDSDFYTFGYRGKPWNGTPIAGRREILSYLDEAIDEAGLGEHIRYQHRVLSANWSSDLLRWQLEVAVGSAGKVENYSAKFLWMCQGYYDHDTSHTQEWPDMDRFEGIMVHPQHWPENLDYAGKKVVVIGSGATTATLIPSLADRLRAGCAGRLDPRHPAPRLSEGRKRPSGPGRVRILTRPGSCSWTRSAPSSAPISTSIGISTRPIGPGNSASPSCPTAICSRR